MTEHRDRYENENVTGANGKLSRRKLLASLGAAGGAALLCSLPLQAGSGHSRLGDATLLESVYGESKNKDKLTGLLSLRPVVATTIADLRGGTHPVPLDLYYVRDPGQEGLFRLDTVDSTSPDNTGMTLVAADGKRFKRIVQDTIVNVTWFGAKGDGTTDDTDAINAAIEAMPSIANSYGGASGVLYFPAGRFITRGGHIIPANKRMQIRGDGTYITILNAMASANTDIMTIKSPNSGLTEMTIDGNRNQNTAGDCLVLDNAYTYARNCGLTNAAQNGISIGKSKGAIGHILSDVYVSYAKQYGIKVFAGPSTDGVWCNVNVGPTGRSGVRLDSGAQNLANVHVWGAGTDSATERSGFHITTSNCHFANCESETNRGYGWFFEGIGSRGNCLSGCYSWGNGAAGIYAWGNPGGVISGSTIYDNGVNNTYSAQTPNFSGILLENSVNWTITGNNIYDTGVAIPPVTYSIPPAFAYVGRAAIKSQTYAFAEAGTTNFISVSGNTMRAEQTSTGVPMITISADSVWGNNHTGRYSAPAIASAATLTLPPPLDTVKISGTADITNIEAYTSGRRVTLVFNDDTPGTVRNTGNLKLVSDYTPAKNHTLTLVCDGTDWYEVSRT